MTLTPSPLRGEGWVRGLGSRKFATNAETPSPCPLPAGERDQIFRLSVRIASSSPARVSGNIRSCMSWRMIWVDWL